MLNTYTHAPGQTAFKKQPLNPSQTEQTILPETHQTSIKNLDQPHEEANRGRVSLSS